jgi:hypothetical protein
VFFKRRVEEKIVMLQGLNAAAHTNIIEQAGRCKGTTVPIFFGVRAWLAGSKCCSA